MSIEQSQYSGSQSAQIELVELTDGTTTLRYVFGNDDLTIGGNTYTALPMNADSLAPPALNSDGSQELTISLDNVDGRLAVFAFGIKKSGVDATLTRTTYDESDLSSPLLSYTMTIKSATYTIMSAEFTCRYMNILDLAWPRRTYNLIFTPGIKYL